jgi:SMC interacting uncharacterized protein involved in chromosome segregation
MTTTLTPMLLQGEGYNISITPEAIQEKQSLIQMASKITAVTDAQTSHVARNTMKLVNDMMIEVEKSRKEVKAPVLQVGERIDTAARDFVKELNDQKTRLNGLISEHAAEQARLAREAAEKQRQIELEQARLEAEQARQKAEAERLQREAELAAANAKNAKQRAAAQKAAEEARLKAEAEAERLRQEQEDAEAKMRQAEMEAEDVVVVRGVKPTLDYEVVDIHLLYKAYPGLCDITVRRKDILSFLKGAQEAGDDTSLPGLKIVEKFNVSTR